MRTLLQSHVNALQLKVDVEAQEKGIQHPAEDAPESAEGTAGATHESKSVAAQMQEQLDALQQQLQRYHAELQKTQQERSQVAAAAAAAEATVKSQLDAFRKAAAAIQRFEADWAREVHDANLERLKKVDVPQGKELECQGQLHRLLCGWADAGATEPITFQDLVAHSTYKKEAPKFVKKALDSYFPKFFPDEPGLETCIPRQACRLLHASLGRLKDTYEAQETAKEVAAQAAEAYVIMEGTSKKRRSTMRDAVME